MKKLLFLALFALGIYNTPAIAMAQEIILTELYSMTPFDDPKDELGGRRPGGNRFHASIDSNQLNIDTDTDVPAYAEVIAPETGEIIAEEEFTGETTISIPKEGDYEVYIYTESGTVMAGEFSVE